MSSAAPVLALQGIRRRFVQGPVALDVLQGIDLSLPPGTIAALVGPSGTGKSTLLHIAGLLERPSAGEVTIDGRACGGLADAERTRLRRERIGFVYQFHHLLPDFTALENVAMPLLIAGRSQREAQAHARALLERLGLAARLDHRPARLSGGEQQRVAIGRALANAPGSDPGRRADRQSRPAYRRGSVRDPARGGARHGYGGADRHPQSRARGSHGPTYRLAADRLLARAAGGMMLALRPARPRGGRRSTR